MLVIVPESSEKTLIFVLPAFIEKRTTVSIVIVPLTALFQDLLERCRNAGLGAQKYSSELQSYLRSSVVHVYAEQVPTEGFQNFLHSLHAQQRLSRIIIDEAHMTIADSDYRAVTYSLENTVRPIGI